jgi:outer membrane cobalamin receptor
MRLAQTLFLFLLFSGAALAADLKIKVIDPQSAAVAGAQVVLLRDGSTTPVAIATTSGEGIASFHVAETDDFQVRVLAPGFAAATQSLAGNESFTVALRVAVPPETVVVSATRTPAESDATGSAIESLNSAQLQTMQPVAASDAIRFLPGAIVATAGQRGGIASLFVRGGDSRYNKVIIDGVPVDEPGGTFDFGVVPVGNTDRLEFLRGAQSTLYGSDAMTSVVQLWTAQGQTRVPELKFGADGGNFNTAHGYASLAGARGRFDYNLFGDQFNTQGSGINDDYSNSSEGANLGLALNDHTSLRIRARHANSRTGVQGEWLFNGAPLLPPDSDQWARQNNLLGSVQLSISGPSRWQQTFTGFEYDHRRTNVDDYADPGRIDDFPTHAIADLNRAGFDYQATYQERTWAQTTFGYEFEDENGFVGDLDYPPIEHGLRLNQAAYLQEFLTLKRFTVIAGARFVHNTTFGNTGVPRVALTYQLLKGGEILSGTQLRFSYATGIKEASFDEAFATGFGIIPNPNLKAEENRAFEAGFEQNFVGGRYSLTATYYNNLFRNQINFAILDYSTFTGEYMNIDKSIAHGAEVEFRSQLTSHLSLNTGYNYTSSQILEEPFAFASVYEPGQPLLRRPKHSGSLLLNYLGRRWGGNVGGSFIGRRADSDFLGLNIDHAAGYARVDLGGWYQVTSHVTAYANVVNALNKEYEEVVGYPALGVNFRAGLRFRFGGE